MGAQRDAALRLRAVAQAEECCQGLVPLGETPPGGASLVGSYGDGETLSLEMPTNEPGKAQLGTTQGE